MKIKIWNIITSRIQKIFISLWRMNEKIVNETIFPLNLIQTVLIMKTLGMLLFGKLPWHLSTKHRTNYMTSIISATFNYYSQIFQSWFELIFHICYFFSLPNLWRIHLELTLCSSSDDEVDGDVCGEVGTVLLKISWNWRSENRKTPIYFEFITSNFIKKLLFTIYKIIFTKSFHTNSKKKWIQKLYSWWKHLILLIPRWREVKLNPSSLFNLLGIRHNLSIFSTCFENFSIHHEISNKQSS